MTVQFELISMELDLRDAASGTRLLVTGEARWGGAPLDNAIAWGCGFTQGWTEEQASVWAGVFKAG